MSFPLVTDQSKVPANVPSQIFPDEPKIEELKKEVVVFINTQSNVNPSPQSLNTNTLQSKKVSKRPDMSIPFRKPFSPQSETQPNPLTETQPKPLIRIDEEIKRETSLERAMANASTKVEVIIQLVGADEFDDEFDLERTTYTVNEGAVFFEIDDVALSSKNIESSLAVGVVGFDRDGKVIAKGLGNFNEQKVKIFCGHSRGRDEIKFLIESIKDISGKNMAIVLAGMHTSKYLEELKAKIRSCYGNKIQFSHLMNPWRIPQITEESDKNEFKQFLSTGFSLKMGIKSDGKILYANASNENKGFLRFSELNFQKWKASMNFKTPEDFSRYEGRLVSTAEEIYNNRKSYSIPGKEVAGIEEIKNFCKGKGLSFEELLINPQSFDCFIKSDNLRRGLYLYLSEKLTPGLDRLTLRNLMFLEEIKNKILDSSIVKTIKTLSRELPDDNKKIRETVKIIFPGLLSEFFHTEGVKQWFKSKNGEKVRDAIVELYGNTI